MRIPAQACIFCAPQREIIAENDAATLRELEAAEYDQRFRLVRELRPIPRAACATSSR